MFSPSIYANIDANSKRHKGKGITLM